LLYNLQEIERKKQTREQEQQQILNNNVIQNEEALSALVSENRKGELRRIERMNLLKDSYERQIREKEERAKAERKAEEQYFHKQQDYVDYQENRRMLELSRMYNRVTYNAVPIGEARRRIKTEGRGEDYHSQRVKTEGREGTSQGERAEQRYARMPGSIAGLNGVKDSLDELNAESIRYPRKPSQQSANPLT
jgi:hypothetical protein